CSRRGEHVYTSNNADANLYGLEPNFGCCTANFHQGWPKFASHLWMKTPDDGLAVVAYAPCVVEAKVQGKPVKLVGETGYRFRDWVTIKITVPEPMRFPLQLRPPAWIEGLTVRLSSGGAELGGGVRGESAVVGDEQVFRFDGTDWRRPGDFLR